LHNRSLSLEKQSSATRIFVANRAKLMGQDNAMERLRHLKEQTLAVLPVRSLRIKKKKYKGGPNPLSFKKKTNSFFYRVRY